MAVRKVNKNLRDAILKRKGIPYKTTIPQSWHKFVIIFKVPVDCSDEEMVAEITRQLPKFKGKEVRTYGLALQCQTENNLSYAAVLGVE